ncbi:MAG: ADP-ribosylglycohydrolase family protein [Bacteroidetes bacterium]|nr:MAG: ADP-ribosylglycohydrolase family protein [Bacteroidota bacterium]
MNASATIVAKARACMLGLACGDALGTTLEFRAPGTFTPITDMVGGGPFDLKPGEWTDDTSMALCLATSLVECQGFDARDQMQRYMRWFRAGYMSVKDHCFDIGNTTEVALHTFEKTGNPYSGATDPFAAGNGGIMRLAPVVIFYQHDYSQMLKYVANSSRTTHAARTCIDAARYFGTLLWGALHGTDKTTLLSPRYSPVPGTWSITTLAEEIDEIAAGSFKHKQPPDIKGSGYVVKSLEAALWAFYHSNTFEEGALMAVNLGADADTTGAVYGQLAGAYYGEAGIPQHWKEQIAMKPLILSLAEKLAVGGKLGVEA